MLTAQQSGRSGGRFQIGGTIRPRRTAMTNITIPVVVHRSNASNGRFDAEATPGQVVGAGDRGSDQALRGFVAGDDAREDGRLRVVPRDMWKPMLSHSRRVSM
jgi:hypothetical protein